MDFTTFYRSMFNIEYVLQVFVAIALCVYPLKRKKNFAFRAVLCMVAITALYVILRYVDATYVAPLKLNFKTVFIKFEIVLFITLFAMKICFDESYTCLAFCLSAAQITQHFSHLVGSVFFDTSSISSDWINYVISRIIIFYLVYGALYFLFLKRIKDKDFENINNGRLTLVVLLGVCISFVLDHYGPKYFGIPYTVFFDVVKMFLSFTLLLYQFSFLDTSSVTKEKKMLQLLLEESHRQYALTGESIEIINLKCHDLKKQLKYLSERSSENKADIEEIIEKVNIYDCSARTGNDTLDVILTDKSLLCEKNNIVFACIADGERLGFMSEMDLCALFGNVLDNAIEAVKGLSNKSKAIINLSVKTVNELLVIHCENFFEGDITFEDDIPLTTKGDSRMHGFGVKSIRYVVNKYGGAFTAEVDKDVFLVNIIIPIAKPQEIE